MDGKKLDQDPMQMPSWSMGMACVWIINRTPEAAGRLWSSTLEDALLNHDDSPNDEIQNARTELINALMAGDVQATGLLPNGQRISIPSLEWEDMTFSYDLRDSEGLVHRAASAGGNLYTDIRLGRQAVVERWPQQDRAATLILQFPSVGQTSAQRESIVFAINTLWNGEPPLGLTRARQRQMIQDCARSHGKAVPSDRTIQRYFNEPAK